MGKHWHDVLPKGFDHHDIDMQDKSIYSKSLSKPAVVNRFDEEPDFVSKGVHTDIQKHKHAKTIEFKHDSWKSKEDVKKIADKHAKAIFRERYTSDDGRKTFYQARYSLQISIILGK